MISASDVIFQYSPGRDFALRCKSFCALGKQVTCIIGPNGGGKSTLLKLLGGRLVPVEGVIRYRGKEMSEISKETLARDIGWIDSNASQSLVEELLVVDHLAMALIAAGVRPPLFHRRISIEKALRGSRVPPNLVKAIAGIAHKRVGDLNAGHRQSLTIALALLGERRVILADEGTATLDISNARMFFLAMRAIARSHGVAIVAVTHDIALAGAFADAIYSVTSGNVRRMAASEDDSLGARIRQMGTLFET